MCDPIDSTLIAGVDEAGRGPLAGPVIAAAVILDPQWTIDGITDSKLLSENMRHNLDLEIRKHALAWAIARADVEEIDRINILQASLLAMKRAIEALAIRPRLALIDGNRCPQLDGCRVEAIIKGDQKVMAIGAASILAKVARDREMVELDARYPGYGFASHKGYPTKAHISALNTLGISPIHRRSYAPVRKFLTHFHPC
jgi:ribonuclease HII